MKATGLFVLLTVLLVGAVGWVLGIFYRTPEDHRAILVSAAAIKGGDSGGTDEFIARQAWLYVAIVAGAYFIGRGLAKAGSHDPYTDRLEDGDRNGR